MLELLRPRMNETAAEWIRTHFYSHTGEAFSEQQSPWVTAPQGPCWAYDSIQFRTIWLQWAARMFKTNFTLAMLQRSMDQRPEETMFATPDETNCKSVFGRFWKMIEHCPRLRDQAPRAIRQSKTQIKLQRSVCHGAWPRGKSRLADKSIRVGVGNEIDKWVVESTSTEGDPIQRFRKRGAEYPDRKFILESTPSVRGRSAIETGRLQSTNHRYQVPCPHCFKFQTLEFGDGTRPGMIHYEKTLSGQTDRGLARRTAHYVCLHCEGRIEDIHRPWMINRGVWVPAGCQVNHERAMEARNLPPDDMSWLTGTPRMWGSDYGSQISVFYALYHGWGDIVDDFLAKCKKPKTLQQWINEDKGETWAVKKSKSTPEIIGERLNGPCHRGIVPDGVRFLTCTIDRQAADGGFVKYVVLGHDLQERSWLIDKGVGLTLGEIWEPVVRRQYQRQSGGAAMTAILSAADSGWDTKGTYDFCNEHPAIFPCKGSSTDMAGKPFKLAETQSGKYKGQMLFEVNTDFWETDLQACLDERLPSEHGSLVLNSDDAKDIDFLGELCNGTLSDKVDQRGNARLQWVKKEEADPNDWRDAVRYGRALAALVIESGGVPPETIVAQNPKPVERQEKSFIRQPENESSGGWIRRRSN
jgi:phage terminase large subunit GpA-like protein